MEKSTKHTKSRKKYKTPKITDLLNGSEEALGWPECVNFIDVATGWNTVMTTYEGIRRIVMYVDPSDYSITHVPFFPVNYIKLELTC